MAFRFYQRKGGEGVAPVKEFRPKVAVAGPPKQYNLFVPGQEVGIEDGTLVLIPPGVAEGYKEIIGVINGVSRYRVDTATQLPLFQPSGRILDPLLFPIVNTQEVIYSVVMALDDVIFVVDYADPDDGLADTDLGNVFGILEATPDYTVLDTDAPNADGGWILEKYNNALAKAYVRINPERRSAFIS